MIERVSTRQSLGSELETTRVAYHQLLQEIPINKYSLPTSNPAWNVAEVLFHMSLAPRYISSDVVFIKRLSWIPRPPAFLFHILNKWLTKQGARGATREMLAAKYDEAHHRMMQCFESIDEDEWSKGAEYPGWDPLLSSFMTLESLFHYPSLHFDEHKKEIMVLVDGTS
jgi:hypothetical protein